MKKKSIFYILTLLIFSPLLLEGASFLVLTFRDLPTSGFSEEYDRVVSGINKPEFKKTTNPHFNIRKPHPFFGHVFAQGNNYGFFDPQDFPYQKSEGQKVIGVFGGSTAMHWAHWMQENRFFEREGLEDIVILNFALSGAQQPQQFHVASKFFEYIDGAIFLDGWNESVAYHCPSEPESPPNFDLMVADNTLPLKKRIVELSRKVRQSTEQVKNSFLSFSLTTYLFWKTSTEKKYQELAQLQQAFKETKDRSFERECQTDRYDHSYGIWKKYLNMSQVLAQHFKVPLIHFFQPNPFEPGAKPVGTKEKKRTRWHLNQIKNKYQSGHLSHEFYTRYKEDPPKNSFDMMMVFEDVSEPLYIDPYTHLNNRGYSLLSKGVLEILQAEDFFKK